MTLNGDMTVGSDRVEAITASPDTRSRLLVFAYALRARSRVRAGRRMGAGTRPRDVRRLHGPGRSRSTSRGSATGKRRTATRTCGSSRFRERWITPPSRRHRLTRFVLYLLWLPRAYAIGRSLHRRAPFAAVWHATYSTYWLPTPAVRFRVPCVWGPVGGAVVTPPSLLPLLGWRGLPGELLDLVAVRAFSLWPATRRTWRRARIRLVQNVETLARLPRALQPGTDRPQPCAVHRGATRATADGWAPVPVCGTTGAA